MDELRLFCTRMLGDGAAARSAAEAAAAAGGDDRLAGLRAAVRECRGTAAEAPVTRVGEPPGPAAAEPATAGPAAMGRAATALAAAVAGEVAAATARLRGPEREALALRDLLGLSYDELAAVTEAEPESVGPLLAGARLRLRAELRGTGIPQAACPEHDRARSAIAARQDDQPVPAADTDWLIEHLGHCRECAQAHAAILEAAACYRAWAAPPGTGDVANAGAGPAEAAS